MTGKVGLATHSLSQVGRECKGRLSTAKKAALNVKVGFLTGPRVPYAMARDGNFFDFAKRVQSKFHTPSGAVVFQGCVAILLVLTGTHQELYSYAMFGTWTFMGLTAVALIRLRSTEPELARPFHVWGYPWTPMVFGIAAFAISANLWLVRPLRSSIGLAIVLLGIPFFYRWRRRSESRSRVVETATSASQQDRGRDLRIRAHLA